MNIQGESKKNPKLQMENSNNQFIIAKNLKQDMLLEIEIFLKKKNPNFKILRLLKDLKSQFLQTLNNYNTLIHFNIDQLLKN
jgi:hypothetical protein